MKLFQLKQKIDGWIQRAKSRADAGSWRAESQHPASPNPLLEESSGRLKHGADTNLLRDPIDERAKDPKVAEWRRRVLVKKGARLHASMLERSDRGSLAMLDAFGMVVCWYEGVPERPARGDHRSGVLKHHVSQFYLPTDVATGLPLMHLRNAAVAGTSTQRGWRRRPDGSTLWATTVIESLVLRGGSLQGFSHIVRESKDPTILVGSGAAFDGANSTSGLMAMNGRAP
jgi:hypothetical protein